MSNTLSLSRSSRTKLAKGGHVHVTTKKARRSPPQVIRFWATLVISGVSKTVLLVAELINTRRKAQYRVQMAG